jgi:DNA-3-methyladenine glycosylase
MSQPHRLDRDFFERSTLVVARALLGQRLVRSEEVGLRTSGLIVETEAYVGTEDLGCHARAGRTLRNKSMWGPPGHAYVYFTYGMHWMLNFVTESDGFPAAVLIRALVPREGLERIRQRRSGRADPVLTNGPAKLCQALAVDRSLDGVNLCHPDSTLFVEIESQIPDAHVLIGPRVGLNTVPEPWKSIPWRFRVDQASMTLLSDKGGR